jgi:SAM-dependent methyltransferase
VLKNERRGSVRKSIKEFVRIVAETLPILEPVYEFGSLQVPGQEGIADLRVFFAGKEYIGCDMQEGPGVDRILNLHNIDLPSETIGTVLILDTLEHVEFVRRAIEEAHRILKPNGILVISSVMKFPIHNFPYDYWRFTPEGFRSLLKPFNSSFVDFAGNKQFPHTVVGIGFKGAVSKDKMEVFVEKMKYWKRRSRRPPKDLWKTFAKWITHPGNLCRRLKEAGSQRNLP